MPAPLRPPLSRRSPRAPGPRLSRKKNRRRGSIDRPIPGGGGRCMGRKRTSHGPAGVLVGAGFERARLARPKEEAYRPESHGDWRQDPPFCCRASLGAGGARTRRRWGGLGEKENFDAGSSPLIRSNSVQKRQWLQSSSFCCSSYHPRCPCVSLVIVRVWVGIRARWVKPRPTFRSVGSIEALGIGATPLDQSPRPMA